MIQNTLDKLRQEVLFITEQDVKVKTPMSNNKVELSLVNYITLAQDMYIKKTLGATLYSNLLAEWIQSSYNPALLPDGTITGTPPIIPGDETNYQELFHQIQKTLIWYSYILSLPHIAIKVVEAGITMGGTDYSESAGIVGLDRLVREGKMVAQSYMELLQTYICETFKGEESIEDSKDVGGASIGIFVPRRNHHRNRNLNCSC